MRKHLLLSAIFLGSIAVAQTLEGVGVATDSPTETFHVEGTARITDLPQNESENAIGTNTDGSIAVEKSQTFNATKTVVVDDNGVLGTVAGLPAASAGRYENEEGTEIFIPEKKCAKNAIGGTDKKWSMDFEKAGYRFTWYDKGASKVQLDVQRIGDYINQERRAKTTFWFSHSAFYGGDRGDFTVKSTPERVVDMSYLTSTAGMLTLILADTAQAFHIDMSTLHVIGKGKVMNICIEQTVF